MVWGNLGTGHWLGAAGGTSHWVELARTKLSSSADDITVSSLTSKPYLMILGHVLDTGGVIETRLRCNSDTGSNYSRRNRFDGSESTATSQDFMTIHSNLNTACPEFLLGIMNNVSDKEKLYHGHSTAQNTAGASNAVSSGEASGKWANTSNAISSVTYHNAGSGSFDTDSECVVLGFDPADASGTNFWEELVTAELSSASDTLTTSTFTPKKYMMIQYHALPNGNIDVGLRVGNSSVDTGSNYSKRESDEFSGGTSGAGSESLLPWGKGSGAARESFGMGYLVNVASKEKLWFGQALDSGGSGGSVTPSTREAWGKWSNTSNQVNVVQLYENGQSGNFASGTKITVWGAD